MRRQRLRKDAAHRQHDERSNKHQLIRDRVENRAKLRALVETAREQAIETVSDTREDEASERKYETLVKEE